MSHPRIKTPVPETKGQDVVLVINSDASTELSRLSVLRKQVLKYIALFNRTLRKHDVAIQLPMLVIMAGTLYAIISTINQDKTMALQYDAFRQRIDDETAALMTELKTNVTSLINQTLPFESQYQQLKDQVAHIVNLLQSQDYGLGCSDNDGWRFITNKHNCYSRLNTSCGPHPVLPPVRDDFDVCVKLTGPYSSDYIGTIPAHLLWDNCPPLIQQFCTNYTAEFSVSKILGNFKNNINYFNAEIAETKPDYSAFTLIQNATNTFLFLTIAFGEVSPFAIIALTLLTHVFSDYCPSWKWFLSKEDDREVENFSRQERLEYKSSYTTTAESFQRELVRVNKELEPYQSMVNMTLVMLAQKEKDTPISTVPVQLFREIFEFAGFNPKPAEKKVADSKRCDARHAFEMGGHSNNAQIVEIEKVTYINPLYSFFSKLKADKYDAKEKVQEKIYQYAGLILR